MPELISTVLAGTSQPSTDRDGPPIPPAVAEVTGLRLADGTGAIVVDDVSLSIGAGRTLAIVGESGSGKTLTVKAIAGLLPRGIRQLAGDIRFGGVTAPVPGSSRHRRTVRRRIGYVFQDPMVALNPLQPVFGQLAEAVDPDRALPRADRNRRVWALLESVRLPDLEATARKLPGELSGGMCQRVVIAMAIAREPALIIADEPTTALDVTVQAQILSLLRDLRDDLRAALVLISHDIGVVAEHADDLVVMRDGHVVDRGGVTGLINDSSVPYTRTLIRNTPTLTSPRPNEPLLTQAVDLRVRPEGPASILEGTDLVKRYGARHAVDGVSLKVLTGESVGLVGESGSGKTTVVNILTGLTTPDSGVVRVDGAPARYGGRDARNRRSAVQLAFQDAWGSFDPYASILDSISEPLAVHGVDRRQRRKNALALLDEVGLPARLARRRPHELSGGQRQRAGIARALALDPSVLIADEPVSALDVTIQAHIIELLARLQRERQMSLLVVSHDLAVVRQLTSYLYVMDRGQVVEEGLTDDLVGRPRHDFTRRLVASVPRLGLI